MSSQPDRTGLVQGVSLNQPSQGKPSKVRIALAQISPTSASPGPPELERPHSTTPFPTLQVNLEKAAEYLRRSVAGGADLVVFPEYFLQGLLSDGRQYLSFPAPHLMKHMVDLAQTHEIDIVGSIVHGTIPTAAHGQAFPTASPFSPLSSSKPATRITTGQLAWAKYLEQYPSSWEESAEPVLHNIAFYIEGTTGDVKGSYIKRNLWHPERDYLTAGEEEHQVFDTKWGKAGLLICWDMSHPSAAQALADQHVDIVFAPTYWLATDSEPFIHNHEHKPDYELQVISALCMARSFETETVWVMCNAGGDSIEGFAGGSGVWAPLRGRVGGADTSEEGLHLVDIDLGVLKDARRLYKIRQDWSSRQGS